MQPIRKLSLTTKQRWIVNELIRGYMVDDVRVDDLDMDQLLIQLAENKACRDYSPSKAAMQFSLRYLILKGFVEKGERELRRHKARRILKATPLAFQICMPKTVPLSHDGDSELEGIIMEGFEEDYLF